MPVMTTKMQHKLQKPFIKKDSVMRSLGLGLWTIELSQESG